MQQQREIRKTFMIFTEGQTEEGYFKKFKARCKTVKGGSALKIVQEAIVQKKNVQKHYDHYWVVFDKDNSSVESFLKAIRLAEKQDIHVAYSCEAFEIWWLFHFVSIKKPIQAKDYERKIKQYLSDYSIRNKGLQQGALMWMQLNHKLEDAIHNAREAHLQYLQPEVCYNQSITTAYTLAKLLNNQYHC